MTTKHAKLIEYLGRVEPREVSVGHMTLRLFEPHELDSNQTGYSRDVAGRNLTGTAEGEWRSEWLVVGQEDMCGDPVFIDISNDDLPVFTAVDGEGIWEPTLLATSLNGFVAGLRLVSQLGANRSNPVELEGNPLSEPEMKALVDGLQCLGEGAELGCWTNWFEIEG